MSDVTFNAFFATIFAWNMASTLHFCLCTGIAGNFCAGHCDSTIGWSFSFPGLLANFAVTLGVSTEEIAAGKGFTANWADIWSVRCVCCQS